MNSSILTILLTSAISLIPKTGSKGKKPIRPRSPLRWVGGKYKAVLDLSEYFPPNGFKEYREPFFGGGSVGLYIAANHENAKIIVNDLSYELYNFWKIAQKDNERFTEILRKLLPLIEQQNKGKVIFQKAKSVLIDKAIVEASKNNEMSAFLLAYSFFIVNRLAFSGIITAGYSGTRFTEGSIKTLEKSKKLLQNMYIRTEDYSKILNKEGEDVFIFLDPPYYDVTEKLYGVKGEFDWGEKEFRLLKRRLKRTPHKFLLTVNDHPFIRKLFTEEGFYIYDRNYTYSSSATRKKKLELIITNYKVKKKE